MAAYYAKVIFTNAKDIAAYHCVFSLLFLPKVQNHNNCQLLFHHKVLLKQREFSTSLFDKASICRVFIAKPLTRSQCHKAHYNDNVWLVVPHCCYSVGIWCKPNTKRHKFAYNHTTPYKHTQPNRMQGKFIPIHTDKCNQKNKYKYIQPAIQCRNLKEKHNTKPMEPDTKGCLKM